MLELRGYITNLGKYNEGFLIGEWVTFPIDEEEQKAVFERIGINAEYEEYFFTDYESELELDLHEYTSINTLNEIAEKLQEWDEETLKAACEVWSLSEVLDENPDNYILLSNVNDNYDLGYYYAVECCCIDFKENPILERYFDFDAYGRDISFEVSGGFTDYGYIECIG